MAIKNRILLRGSLAISPMASLEWMTNPIPNVSKSALKEAKRQEEAGLGREKTDQGLGLSIKTSHTPFF